MVGACNFTASAQATILGNEPENHTFKISGISPRGKWLKLIYQKGCHVTLLCSISKSGAEFCHWSPALKIKSNHGDWHVYSNQFQIHALRVSLGASSPNTVGLITWHHQCSSKLILTHWGSGKMAPISHTNDISKCIFLNENMNFS